MIRCLIGLHRYEYSIQDIHIRNIEMKHLSSDMVIHNIDISGQTTSSSIGKYKYYKSILPTTCRICTQCMKKQYKDVDGKWIKTSPNIDERRNNKLSKILND